KLAHEVVTAGRQRAQANIALVMAGHDLLDLERGRVEFLGGFVLVDEGDHVRLVRLHMDFAGKELVVLENQSRLRRVGQRGWRQQNGQKPKGKQALHNRVSTSSLPI